MGLAASQGRMLCLTARKNDLIYEGQQISQQRLALADKQALIATEYTDAMNNKIMQAVAPDGTTQQLTFDVLTSQDPFTGLSMRIVDSNGNIVVPNKEVTMTVKQDDNEETFDLSNVNTFIEKYMNGWDEENINKAKGMDISRLVSFYNETADADNKVNVSHSYSHLMSGNENERFCYDENVSDPQYLQKMLSSGEWTVEKLTDVKNDKNIFDSKVWQGSTEIREVYDTSDDAAAEAKYEQDMIEIQKRDKVLELRLEEVQTQEQAVEKDLDSVKSVIDKNVEDSFKTFA